MTQEKVMAPREQGFYKLERHHKSVLQQLQLLQSYQMEPRNAAQFEMHTDLKLGLKHLARDQQELQKKIRLHRIDAETLDQTMEEQWVRLQLLNKGMEQYKLHR
jgi:hypothetical protein